eukprot:TRINITY_DN1291_c0_g1_i12.p1 TRINITY_DN1291_c0_g1~~TRINITY_DN1291_c0_g1_i12.p1  ORF type:complete len:1337 (-),score=114.99 TRINITY_DN1291_c0_g1_i12:1253-5017(-)
MWCWLVKNSSNKVTSSIILSNLTPIAAKDTLPKHASQLFEKQSSSKQNGLDKDCLKSDNYNDLSLLDLISAYYIGTAEKDYALEQFLNFKQKASVIQNKYFPEQSKTFVLTQERLLDALESICEVQIPHTELVRALAILGIEDLQSELDEDTFCVIALIIYSNLFSSLDKHVRQQQIVTQLQDNFNKIDLNGDQLIQAGELDIALERQFGNKIPKELQHQIMSVLDTNRSGVIKFDEFVDNVLHKCWKMQPKDVLSFDANVSDQLFDLSVTSFYEFKKQLLQKAFDHEALNHPYLQLLQEGNFLDIHEVLLDFAVEYRKYSRNFQTFVRTVMDKLESKEHKAVLQENISEESGYLSEEDLAVLAQVGIKKEWVDQIPHPKLFQNFLYVLQNLVGDNMECDNQILTPGQQFGDQVSEFCSNHNAAYALGMLSFGTEAIVKPLYRKIITCIEKYSQLELRQYVFFVLHVEVDDGHADLMMNILQDLDSPATRRDALSGMIEVLNARVQLWEGLLERIDKLGLIKNTKQGYVQGQVKHQGQRQEIALNSVTELYDAQSTNWVRKKPNCLSDFTARPIIFEACEPIKSLRVLDVGCGEGFCAREMRSRGACYVLGCDVSGEMVRAAVQEEVRNPLNGIKYIQADARDLVDSILKQGMSSTVGFASKVQFDSGCFDLAIAVFVFNYMPIQDMYKVGRNVYKLLQPGGRFVFSIPHPSFKYWPVEEGAPFKFDGSSGYFSGRDQMFTNCCSLEVGSCFPYLTLLSNLMVPQDIFLAEIKCLQIAVAWRQVRVFHTSPLYWPVEEGAPFKFDGSSGYFSGRDQISEGIICTKDGSKLNVRNHHKTFEDYFRFLQEVGFVKMPQIRECTVTQELVESDPQFFAKLKDVPLHVIFSVEKPLDICCTLPNKNIFPQREICWGPIQKMSPGFFEVVVCEDVLGELLQISEQYIAERKSYEDVDIKQILKLVPATVSFGKFIRKRILEVDGVVLVKGLLPALFGQDFQQQEEGIKLAYWILCNSIGRIDETRGKLYEVKNRAQKITEDGVLISASDEKASFHTDSTNADYFPDIVGLLCVRPASGYGGEFSLVNSCNVYHKLRTSLPDFLFAQLTLPIVRDVIDRGYAISQNELVFVPFLERFCADIARSQAVLKARILANTFPIFDVGNKTNQGYNTYQQRLTFRYMRPWIESGHHKADQQINPFLKSAMDHLDKALQKECFFHRRLEPGEVVFCNNHTVAHARDAFKDVTGKPGRLMIRAWINV